MEKIYETDCFGLFDNFLTGKEFEYMWTFMQEENYHFYQVSEWKKINRIGDGNHLEGSVYMGENGPEYQNTVPYPSSKALDILFSKIDENLHLFEPWIGKKEEDWLFYALTPFLYPKDTGVSWHDDYTKSSGTFTFYCHPYWNIQWGGELLIADSSEKNVPPHFRERYNTNAKVPIGAYIDNSLQNQQVMTPGYGHYILPKPNRIAFIKAGTLHCVKKVDKNAGDQMRASIQGFFHNPNKIEKRY